jgi:phosphate transport system substrate-binding protein
MKLIAPVLAGALLLAACGGDDEGTAGANEGGGLSGDIVISGSSTVEPISTAVAEAFRAENGDVSISVDGPGTGDGFELFCNGETDISDASRPIEDEELAVCEENGIEFVELKVAIDGISVITAPGFPVECLTFDDIAALAGPDAVGVDRWSDAGDFPDEPLTITAPGEESGTYDTFVELALDGEDTRPDYQASPNDNVIIEGVAGATGSFGWVGYSFYEQNADQLQAFEIDAGDGCVAPSPETIADASYPLSRPLFIYVSTTAAAEKPALAEFVDFYLSDAIGKVTEVGYVALPDDELAATVEAWETR